MFAWAAIPGSLLIARLGALPTLIVGLLVCGVASALRGAAGSALFLYATTLVMSIGIAVMQPTLPPLVRRWMPERVGFGTAVYSNGWLIGEIVAVWATIPYVLPILRGSWRQALVFWSVPVIVTLVLVVVFAPRGARDTRLSLNPRRWWPNWRSGLMWRVALTMGGANIAYWSTNAFIPDFLTRAGRPDMIGNALTILNLGQLPVSLLFLSVASRIAGRTWPLVGMGAMMLGGTLAIMFADGIWILAGAAFVGFACAGILIAVLMIPPLIAAAEDVPRMTAGMFMIAYNCSVVSSILGGALWDATRSPYPAFGLIALGAAAAMILPLLGGGLHGRKATAVA
jgi:CP family cyanate transporter-like MFS transporter